MSRPIDFDPPFDPCARDQPHEHVDEIIGEEDDRVGINPAQPADPDYASVSSAWAWEKEHFPKICRLLITYADGGADIASGVCIEPRVILTAAHCLYSLARRQLAQRIIIQPGYSLRNGTFAKPAIQVGPESLRVPQEYMDDGESTLEYDYGIILLRADYPGGCHKVATLNDAALRRAQLFIVGYPQDKSQGNEQYIGKGSVRDMGPQQLLYTVDTMPGQSGSGIFVWMKSRPAVVGVHGDGNSKEDNVGVRLSTQVLEQIRKWKVAQCG